MVAIFDAYMHRDLLINFENGCKERTFSTYRTFSKLIMDLSDTEILQSDLNYLVQEYLHEMIPKNDVLAQDALSKVTKKLRLENFLNSAILAI